MLMMWWHLSIGEYLLNRHSQILGNLMIKTAIRKVRTAHPLTGIRSFLLWKAFPASVYDTLLPDLRYSFSVTLYWCGVIRHRHSTSHLPGRQYCDALIMVRSVHLFYQNAHVIMLNLADSLESLPDCFQSPRLNGRDVFVFLCFHGLRYLRDDPQ